jgi:beta-lactam-binding protein with PASTA domain
LDALSYSHKAGIIHRDIKPANVMLNSGGVVKVMDFGIARAVADTSATMTQTAAVIGTAQYLSPEQARGETVDARSDIYSAGCLLYELLVGRPPFIGESPVSVAYQHVREAPVPPSQLDPVITPDIDAVTLKALAKDPADRYQSAREMKADISRVLAGQAATAYVPRMAATVPTRPASAYADTPTRVVAPPPVTGPPDDEPEEEERKSRVGLAILITVLVIAVLAVGGYAIYQAITPETPVVQQVEVPNVITYTEQQARDQLAARNLKVEISRENGEEETKGTITAQNPVAGMMVDVTTTVRLTLNEGPETAVIPDNLVGKDVDDVESDLQELDFSNVVAVAAKSENPDTKPDEVLRISPREGSTVALDAKITVTYATGKSEVPNFDGLPRQRAIEVADEAGFDEPTFKEETSDAPEGTVIAQSPKAGRSVDRDTKISLTLAKAPEPTPSPTPTPDPTSPSPSPSQS